MSVRNDDALYLRQSRVVVDIYKLVFKKTTTDLELALRVVMGHTRAIGERNYQRHSSHSLSIDIS